MPRILIVEDDGFKSDEIQSLLDSVCESAKVDLAESVSTAVSILKGNEFDLVVLDMALPSHAVKPGAGSPLSLPTGGLEVLFELQSLGRKDQCVIITQYPEIEICEEFYPLSKAPQAILDKYEISVRDCVEYSESNLQWREILKVIFGEICGS